MSTSNRPVFAGQLVRHIKRGFTGILKDGPSPLEDGSPIWTVNYYDPVTRRKMSEPVHLEDVEPVDEKI